MDHAPGSGLRIPTGASDGIREKRFKMNIDRANPQPSAATLKRIARSDGADYEAEGVTGLDRRQSDTAIKSWSGGTMMIEKWQRKS